MKLTVNGKPHELDVEPEMPLLWALRDELGITGPKYGCGIGFCGACTVHIGGAAMRSCVMPVGQEHIGGAAMRSCVMPVGQVQGEVSTIEGLGTPQALHAVQKAWVELQVAQCGYCQSGQIMTAAAFLAQNANPSDQQIDEAMAANLCRCGTYPRIRAAVRQAAKNLTAKGA